MLEDDTGMELLVSNKIISLDLPVKDVYKKIWAPSHAEVSYIYLDGDWYAGWVSHYIQLEMYHFRLVKS